MRLFGLTFDTVPGRAVDWRSHRPADVTSAVAIAPLWTSSFPAICPEKGRVHAQQITAMLLRLATERYVRAAIGEVNLVDVQRIIALNAINYRSK